MKTKKKTRILSAFLAVLMAVLVFPIAAIPTFAADTSGTDVSDINQSGHIDDYDKLRLDFINGTSNEVLFQTIDNSFNTEAINASLYIIQLRHSA